jgi:CheY-like chemotaxis protein
MPHKLLLADDSITIQRVIELTFADEDVQVAVVGDGRQAIERVQADRPDIVLADVGMPERDGYEVASFIKNHPQLSHIPVVLLSGAFEPLDEQRARTVGCDAVLVKPFEPQMVINRVKELLARRRPAAPPKPSAPAPAAPPPPAVAQSGRAGDDLESTLTSSTQSADKSASEALEDYFDRLDAAFANIGAPAPPRPHTERDDLSASLRDLQPIPTPAAVEPAESLDSWDPDLVGGFAPARQPHLASTFAALLAAEEGYDVPEAAFGTAPPAPAINDDVIEEIVRRVVARMGDAETRRLVLDTAERLVREEIERIKRVGASPESSNR